MERLEAQPGCCTVLLSVMLTNMRNSTRADSTSRAVICVTKAVYITATSDLMITAVMCDANTAPVIVQYSTVHRPWLRQTLHAKYRTMQFSL